MKKGLILYLRQQEDAVPMSSAQDLVETSRSLGVTTVCVAVTTDEAVRGWWKLLTRGMEEVLFMTVGYDVAQGRIASRGVPVRLCGLPIMN